MSKKLFINKFIVVTWTSSVFPSSISTQFKMIMSEMGLLRNNETLTTYHMKWFHQDRTKGNICLNQIRMNRRWLEHWQHHNGQRLMGLWMANYVQHLTMNRTFWQRFIFDSVLILGQVKRLFPYMCDCLYP